MALITQSEIGTFMRLFNRSGYVLNFTTNDFDVFTMLKTATTGLVSMKFFLKKCRNKERGIS